MFMRHKDGTYGLRSGVKVDSSWSRRCLIMNFEWGMAEREREEGAEAVMFDV